MNLLNNSDNDDINNDNKNVKDSDNENENYINSDDYSFNPYKYNTIHK